MICAGSCESGSEGEQPAYAETWLSLDCLIAARLISTWKPRLRMRVASSAAVRAVCAGRHRDAGSKCRRPACGRRWSGSRRRRRQPPPFYGHAPNHLAESRVSRRRGALAKWSDDALLPTGDLILSACIIALVDLGALQGRGKMMHIPAK